MAGPAFTPVVDPWFYIEVCFMYVRQVYAADFSVRPSLPPRPCLPLFLSIPSHKRVLDFIPAASMSNGRIGEGDVYECPRRFRNLNFIHMCPWYQHARLRSTRSSSPTDPSCAPEFTESPNGEHWGGIASRSRINDALDIWISTIFPCYVASEIIYILAVRAWLFPCCEIMHSGRSKANKVALR